VNGAAVERIRDALTEHGCQPRGPALKLRARCPVHESRGPTLAVSQGRKGAVLRCHAACETVDILTALGLAWDDTFDEPREAASAPRAWTPARHQPTPAEEAGAVIVRAVTVAMTAEAMTATAPLRPALSADERVELAEWGSAADADAHYWRVLARWAALACDESYVRQAYKARTKWMTTGKREDRPSYEQFMVLRTRQEDLERAR